MTNELEHRKQTVSSSERSSSTERFRRLRLSFDRSSTGSAFSISAFTITATLFFLSSTIFGQATIDFVPRPETDRTANEMGDAPLAVASADELALRERDRVRRPVAHRPVPIWAGAISDEGQRERFAEQSRKRIAARYQVLAFDHQSAPDTYLEPSFESVGDAPEPVVIEPRPIWEIELDEDQDSPGFYHQDLIARVEPQQSQREHLLSRIIGKLTARHVRKAFRDELNGRREEDLRMTEVDYLEERARISRIGRAGSDSPDFLADSRMDVLDDRDVDEDINLLEWGPIVLDDRGRVGIDVDRISRGGHISGNRIDLANADEDDPRGESLFQGSAVRVDTDLKLSPRVQHFASGDFTRGVGRIRPQIEIDFYDSILKRKYMAIELEGRIDPDGEHAVFLNISLLEY